MLAPSNQRIRVSYLALFLTLLATSSVFGQIYVDDTLFIGNNDGSPFHVPYHGIVDIPVWVTEIYEGSIGAVNLATMNYAVSERLGGNFHYPWNYTFWPPMYWADYTAQSLWFTAANPPDSVGHLADFTFRMDIDPAYINDTLQFMNAVVQFSDSTGYILYIYGLQISQLIIDNITSNDEDDFKPDKFILTQNYPNPFNASTTIEFSLPEESEIKLAVYDLLGRKVAGLFNGIKSAGTHSVTWNANEIQSGIYFARLEAKDTVRNMKMVLLK